MFNSHSCNTNVVSENVCDTKFVGSATEVNVVRESASDASMCWLRDWIVFSIITSFGIGVILSVTSSFRSLIIFLIVWEIIYLLYLKVWNAEYWLIQLVLILASFIGYIFGKLLIVQES